MSQEKYLELLREARENKFVDGVQIVTEETKVEEPESIPAGAESDTKKVDDDKKLELETGGPECDKKKVTESIKTVKNYIKFISEHLLENDEQKIKAAKFVNQMNEQQILEFAKKHDIHVNLKSGEIIHEGFLSVTMSLLGIIHFNIFWVVYRAIRATMNECYGKCGTLSLQTDSRKACLLRCKAKAKDQEIAMLKKMRSKCKDTKNPEKCLERIQKAIQKAIQQAMDMRKKANRLSSHS